MVSLDRFVEHNHGSDHIMGELSWMQVKMETLRMRRDQSAAAAGLKHNHSSSQAATVFNADIGEGVLGLKLIRRKQFVRDKF
jgi:hypothetical protein